MKEDIISQVTKEVTHEQKHRDGIPQLVGGTFLIFAMLMAMAGNASLMVVFLPLAIVGVEALRKRITYPRIGYAKIPEASGRKSLMWAVLAFLIAGLAAFLLYRGKAMPGEISSNIHLYVMWGVALIIVALAVVVFINKRSLMLVWYALAAVVFSLAVLLFRPSVTTMYWVALGFGALQVILGTINLITFIKKYPVMKDGE
jgi:hypothetical protein